MANQCAGKAASEIPALKPYRGKPAVRNFRGDGGNAGIIEARLAPPSYSTRTTLVFCGAQVGVATARAKGNAQEHPASDRIRGDSHSR
jgi:hypothetical protein